MKKTVPPSRGAQLEAAVAALGEAVARVAVYVQLLPAIAQELNDNLAAASNLTLSAKRDHGRGVFVDLAAIRRARPAAGRKE